MARKSTSTRRRTARPAKSPKRTKRSGRDMSAVADAENHVDGCDVDFTQGAITEDADLPPARGGVEIVQTSRRRTTGRT